MGAAAPVATPARSRRALVEELEEIQRLRDEWIRRQVLRNGRVDVLATEVLGYECRPHHLRILKHQDRFRDNVGCQTLAWRGAGKSKIGTVTRVLFEILRNRDVRICLATRSSDNFVEKSNEIRRHFESNQTLRRIFGDFVGSSWDKKRWSVSGRSPGADGLTVSVVGIESAVAGQHFDLVLGDDLQDLEWARTATTRERVNDFVYTTLKPALEPHGAFWVFGTRYNPRDLYDHFATHEMEGERTLVIPALVPVAGASSDARESERFRSQWPEKFSVETLLAIRTGMGPIAFEAQYQCSAELMKGEIFDFDDFVMVDPDEIPKRLPRYLGADLAIGERSTADDFVCMVIAHDKATDDVWIVDAVAGKRSFFEQRLTVAAMFEKHDCVRGVVESVQYQAALIQELKRTKPSLRILPWAPREDKVTRAHRQQFRVADGRVRVRKGLEAFVEQMTLFPKAEHDDWFDAYDMATRAIVMRRKKHREKEPGLI